MVEVVRRTAERVFIPFAVGGGVSTLDDIRNLLVAGADKVSINSAAVKDPSIITEGARKFGSQCMVVAIDARKDGSSYQVYINGGRIPAGKDALEWAQEVERRGAGEILLTSMDKDGTKDGYDLELTAMISDRVGIPVIASGGAGNLDHLYQAVTLGRADAVLCASIFHYREYTIAEAKQFLRDKGVAVRL